MIVLKYIYMFFTGFIYVNVEGFFIERFLNICRNKKIFIQNLHRENSTYIKMKILKSDFKEVARTAKKTKCKIKIEKKSGMPFIINRYRKRKIFAVAIIVIAIFIFGLTRFIWNIEIVGNKNIEKAEIINLVNNYGIKVGCLKNNVDVEKISNLIRLERDDLSWIGITIKGTNAIVTIEEATEAPKIIDKTEVCNVVASKSAVISKIVVQNGTARVNVGDKVEEGDLLVEGIMESELTDSRNVHAEADVFGKYFYEKEKKEQFVQNETIETGKQEKKTEICINNFKINFNKGVSKFKNYDTICTNKKLKLFSNFYFPIEIKKLKNIELENCIKNYTPEELKEKITNELEEELEKEYEISKYEDKYKKRSIDVKNEDDGLRVKIVYEIQENIGIEKK